MDEFKQVLKSVYSLIPNELYEKLTLVGSVNMLLQGVNVTPKKDIDLGTDYDTVQKLAKVFMGSISKHCDKQEGDESLPFSYLFIEVDGHEIEFFDTKDYGQSYYLGLVEDSNQVQIEISADLNINGLQLEKELQATEKAGKVEKVKILKNLLEESEK